MAYINTLIAPSLSILAAYLVLSFVYRAVYNLLFHPLRNFPGPVLARATKWYETYFDVFKSPGGQYIFEVDRLHREYGPIVRINPDELHVDDIDYFDTVYTLNKRRDKDPYHVQIFGTPLSLFGSERHEVHKPRRQAMNNFFSRASVARLEPLIHQHIRKMCDKISQYGKQGKLILIRNAAVAVTVDIVTEYSFGKPANALDIPDFAPHWEEMMSGVTEAVPVAKSFPGIVQVMQKLPLEAVRLINPLMGAFFDYNAVVREQVRQARLIWSGNLGDDSDGNRVIDKEEKSSEEKRTTIFRQLLESDLPPHEKSEDRLTQEGVGFISAASETTSTVLNSLAYYVFSNPELRARLREEICTIMPDPHQYAKWQQLEKLPLLAATIKEGLRISMAICGRLPLISSEPLQYNDMTIPAGTSVSMSTRDALMNPSIFINPTSFQPDRWLTADPEQRSLMDKAYLPFNKGPRMCVGFNLAYADLYLNMACLIARFDLEVVDTDPKRDVNILRDHFVAKYARGSVGTKLRVVKEY